jgi:hypothetical protein
LQNNKKIDDLKSNFLVIINKYKIKVVINWGNKRNLAPEIKKTKTGDPFFDDFFTMNPKIGICRYERIDYFARECKYIATFSTR